MEKPWIKVSIFVHDVKAQCIASTLAFCLGEAAEARQIYKTTVGVE